MTKFTSFFLAISSLAMLTACSNSGYKKTSSGIMYKIIPTGNQGELVKKGEILKIHYSQKLNDSLMFSSFNSIPTYAKVDSVGPIYSPAEVLPLLHKGDSVIIVQLADTIMKKMPPGSPSQLKKGDKIVLTLKVQDILKSDELAQADQTKEIASQTTKESVDIQNYLATNKINTQKTPGGVFVDIKTPGDGPAVDSGKFVSVKYTGKLFPSGKVFETNTDRDPIQFTVNGGQVIPGWDEGLKLLKKGGKATFYIPSTMAYGQQQGPGGSPFENLIFDIEVVDVANSAPPVKANPQMPMPGDTTAMQGQQKSPSKDSHEGHGH